VGSSSSSHPSEISRNNSSWRQSAKLLPLRWMTLTHLAFPSVLLCFIRDSSIRRNFRQERLRRGFRNHSYSLTRARPRARLPRPGRRLRSQGARAKIKKLVSQRTSFGVKPLDHPCRRLWFAIIFIPRQNVPSRFGQMPRHRHYRFVMPLRLVAFHPPI
jgi:hypothetical protein